MLHLFVELTSDIGISGVKLEAKTQGIFGALGVTDTDIAGTPSYDHFSNLFYRLTGANETPNGLVNAPRRNEPFSHIYQTPKLIRNALF